MVDQEQKKAGESETTGRRGLSKNHRSRIGGREERRQNPKDRIIRDGTGASTRHHGGRERNEGSGRLQKERKPVVRTRY
jgi:hypothetical protein